MKKLTIVKTGINGEGIAFDHGIPVFCPGALPGEVILADVQETEKRYKTARLRKILTASAERVSPVCPCSEQCGGCGFLHLSYPAQLEEKKKALAEALWKYAHVKSDLIRETRPSSLQLSYRSALKLPVRDGETGLVTGMYQPGSNRFIEIEHCAAHTGKLEECRKAVLQVLSMHGWKAYDDKTKKGIRFLVMREMEEKVHVALITGQDTFSKECIEALSGTPWTQSVFQSIQTERRTRHFFGSAPRLLAGTSYQTISIGEDTFSLSPDAFFQLNLNQASELYRTAISKVDPCERLCEVYCGIGAMSILARKKARQITGIEAVAAAVENARLNARNNNCDDHVSFICGDAAEVYRNLSLQQKFDIVLADPPRSGFDDHFLQALIESPPRKIIYISCNPSTLGKNLKILKQHNYQVRTVIPFDMFPNSPHVESITVLER